ncbi:MAG TPA: DUF5915 domain-containing protein, partial [Acidimicrobiales bacterium]|nr:DUF5915 domain-containing protein [Acidimicrobiales bacterium]
DDLSNWYVRCNRRRFWRTDPNLDRADGLAAHAALHEALVVTAGLLAPFCPFLADHIWSSLTGADEDASVHLSDWPAIEPAAVDPGLEAEMELARRLVSLGRAARAQAGVKVRQPLRRAVVALPPDSPPLLDRLVAEELNVDEVVVADRIGEILSFEVVPNFRVLGPRLGEAVKHVRPALAGLDVTAAVEALERDSPLRVTLPEGVVEIGADEVEVRVQAREGFSVSREGRAAVALDLDVDDELRRRGLLRDVIRQVQALRRDAGFQMSDRIELNLGGLDELEPFAELIGREVLAVRVSFTAGPGEGSELETDRPGVEARAWLGRVPTEGAAS